MYNDISNWLNFKYHLLDKGESDVIFIWCNGAFFDDAIPYFADDVSNGKFFGLT